MIGYDAWVRKCLHVSLNGYSWRPGKGDLSRASMVMKSMIGSFSKRPRRTHPIGSCQSPGRLEALSNSRARRAGSTFDSGR